MFKDKIERVVEMQHNNNPNYEIGSIDSAYSYIQADTLKPWYSTISGVSSLNINSVNLDSNKGGWCIVRPKGTDFKVDLNPKSWDMYGSDAGKVFAVGAGQKLVAEVLNRDTMAPTIAKAVALPVTTTTINTAQHPGQAAFNQTVAPIDPNAALDPTGGQLNIFSSSSPTHAIDVLPDGTKVQTQDNGLSPNGTSIRSGNMLHSNSEIKFLNSHVTPGTAISAIRSLLGK